MAGNRVALLLGAGASCAFGYPTTKQFFEKIDIPDYYHKVIFDHIRASTNVKDIEHILAVLDSIVVLGNNPLGQNALTAMIPNVQLTDKTSLKWQDFVKNCEGLKKRHNRPNLFILSLQRRYK